MLKKKLEKPDDKTVKEKRYYISSLPVDAGLFLKAAGGQVFSFSIVRRLLFVTL